ncbi:MAG: cytochrome c [Deltaproteobacteria bacterium]|nr:cytochrome c [Deltaproteobacteria bacterium]
MKTFMSIALVLWLAGMAPAAEPVHGHTKTPEMRRQHNSMSVTNKQWAVCKKCLEAGDFAAAAASLAKMQKAAGDLEKFKLHKNSELDDNFKEQTDNFRKNLSELGKAIKEKDKARTQGLSATIDNSCMQCHAVFR